MGWDSKSDSRTTAHREEDMNDRNKWKVPEQGLPIPKTRGRRRGERRRHLSKLEMKRIMTTRQICISFYATLCYLCIYKLMFVCLSFMIIETVDDTFCNRFIEAPGRFMDTRWPYTYTRRSQNRKFFEIQLFSFDWFTNYLKGVPNNNQLFIKINLNTQT